MGRMIKLLFILIMVSIPSTAFALDDSYYTCKSDSDCILVSAPCNGKDAVNKDKAEEAQEKYNAISRLIECSPLPEPRNPRAICHRKKKKCQLQQTIRGKAEVTDGDTIRIGDERIRLEGIDAPELKQLCYPKDRTLGDAWSCGEMATNHLKELIKDWKIECSYSERDKYNRILGTCWRLDTYFNESINEAMVLDGMAVAYRKYSEAYVGAEEKAKEASKGVWVGGLEMPWNFRKKNR